MLFFVDSLSQLAFASTLRHEQNLVIREAIPRSWLFDRAMVELMQRANWNESSQGLHVCRLSHCRNDFWPETNISKEFSFSLVQIPSDKYGSYPLTDLRDRDPWLVGAWINHGTADEPNWSSHT